jgi:hypothetical protein
MGMLFRGIAEVQRDALDAVRLGRRPIDRKQNARMLSRGRGCQLQDPVHQRDQKSDDCAWCD